MGLYCNFMRECDQNLTQGLILVAPQRVQEASRRGVTVLLKLLCTPEKDLNGYIFFTTLRFELPHGMVLFKTRPLERDGWFCNDTLRLIIFQGTL